MALRRRLAQAAYFLLLLASPVWAQREYVVQRGDSLYSLSQNLLGSCAYYRHFLAMNPDLRVDQTLREGQVLLYDPDLLTTHYDLQKTVERGSSVPYACLSYPVLKSAAPPLVAPTQEPQAPKEGLRFLPVFAQDAPSEASNWIMRVAAAGRVKFMANRAGADSPIGPSAASLLSVGITYKRSIDLEIEAGKGIYQNKDAFVGLLGAVTLVTLNENCRNCRLLGLLGGEYFFGAETNYPGAWPPDLKCS